ncbi:protein phosphatase 2C domain-containing protein [Rhodobacter capsulatus]|uniref:protein phosphatase 2C domain-containing protein n=1 Tax=Rhodobacter capsulatus TaxID=1061 RepID=UPI00402A2683
MRSIFGSATVGDRDHQEDDFTFVLADDLRPDSTALIVLCDGMGGHVSGEIASQTAVRAFKQRFESDASTDPKRRLLGCLEAANRTLGEAIRTNPRLEGMGCTLIGAIKAPNRLFWVSVGDSHLYLFRAGSLTKLNADHSLFSELLVKVRKGELTLEEARANPRRNALLSAVMGAEIPLVDYNEMALKEGDLLILASDGLDTLSSEQLERMLRGAYGTTPEDITRLLLDAVRACRKPRQDNTTVVACYHTTRSVPFWKESTHWAVTGPGWWRPHRSSPRLLLGAAAGLFGLGALIGAIWMMLASGPEPEPVIAHELAPVQTAPVAPSVPAPETVAPKDTPPPPVGSSSIGSVQAEVGPATNDPPISVLPLPEAPKSPTQQPDKRRAAPNSETQPPKQPPKSAQPPSDAKAPAAAEQAGKAQKPAEQEDKDAQ